LLSFREPEFRRQCQQLEQAGIAFERIRHRGLGTISPALLERCCVNPATRLAHPPSVEDAALAVQVFAASL